MSANDRQVGGIHYGGVEFQHWDIVHAHELDYFQGQITKYVMRWKAKNGLEDLMKARHFLDKYIELNTPPEVWVDYAVNPDRDQTVTGSTHPGSTKPHTEGR